MEFISTAESKYCDVLKSRKQFCPIGKLDDIEIVFLHYASTEEALEKWERRKARVNYNKLLFKISSSNFCNDQILDEFDALPCNKIILTNKKYNLCQTK